MRDRKSDFDFVFPGLLPGQKGVLVCPKEEHDFWLTYKRYHPEYHFLLKSIEDVEKDYSYIPSRDLVPLLLKKSRDYESSSKEKGKSCLHLHYLDAKTIASILLSPLLKKEPEIFSQFGLKNIRSILENEGWITPPLYPDVDYQDATILVDRSSLKRIAAIFEHSKIKNLAILPFDSPIQKPKNDDFSSSPFVEKYPNRFEEIHALLNHLTYVLEHEDISPSSIYIYGLDEEAKAMLRDLGENYGIPFDKSIRYPLSSTPIFKSFIGFLQEFSYKDAYLKVKDMHQEIKDDLAIKCIRNLCRKYGEFADLSLWKEIASSTMLSTPSCYEEYVRFTNNLSIPPFSYVYLFSFDTENYPFFHPIGGLFSEEEKGELGINTAKEEDRIWKTFYNRLWSERKILGISYSEQVSNTRFISSLVNGVDGKYVLKERASPKLHFEYAKDKGLFYFSSLIDDRVRFGYTSEVYNLYLKEWQNEPSEVGAFIKSVHEQKEGHLSMDKKDFRKIELSATSLRNFYQCPFAYYCSDVLHLDPFVTNFPLSLGNVIHQVLMDLGKKRELFHFSNSYKNALEFEEKKREENNTPLTSLEKVLFFIEEEHVYYIANSYTLYFKEVERGGENLTIFAEESFSFPLEAFDTNTLLKGRFDAIYCLRNGEYVIVDYKTGQETFSIEGYRYGIKPQLPLYAFWADKSGVIHGKKEPLIHKNWNLLGLFIAKAYGNSYPVFSLASINEKEEDWKIDEDAIASDLGYRGIFSKAIETSNFVVKKNLNSRSKSTWINGIACAKKDEQAKGKIYSTKNESLLILDQETKNILLAEHGDFFDEIYFPSIYEEIALATSYISSFCFPVAPLVVNLDALDEEEEPREEENEEETSSHLSQKSFKFFACSNCSYHDVCYATRENYRRNEPDYQNYSLFLKRKENANG